MKKKLLAMLIISIIMVNCTTEDSNNPGTKTIDFEKFTLRTPLEWDRFYPQGTDGFYGGLTNKKDTLYFDYGPFAFSSLDDIKSTEETISVEELVVNSFDSKIIISKTLKEDEFALGFYTVKGDDENTNSIYSYNMKDEQTLRQIFLSHTFK